VNLNFASDNQGPVHPKVLQALAEANEGPAPAYGACRWTARAVEMIREVLEAPEAAVHLVATGTAANSLALATLARPWDAIFCTEMAHVQEDECNAPELFTGGAKLVALPAPDAKLCPERLREAMAPFGASVHQAQRGPVTLTQATEKGNAYTVAEIAEVASVAHDMGSRLHMDGTRLANALARQGATPAAMTWQAGVDALSFGGTKNGLMGVEAVVLFDPSLSRELELRRKRAAHLFSKHRYLAAQMIAYLTDRLWLDLAGRANAAMDRLARGLVEAGWAPDWPAQANLAFVRLPRAVHRTLHDAGATYYLWGSLEGEPSESLLCRLVCDWSKTERDVDRFLEVARAPC
jgi:threonine aldolase